MTDYILNQIEFIIRYNKVNFNKIKRDLKKKWKQRLKNNREK